MPTKRNRVPRNPLARVTPEALAAWRAGDRLALHRELRLRPWDHNPLDTYDKPRRHDASSLAGRVIGGVRPIWVSQDRWDQAITWRNALEQADRDD
jgi:hypothetical protein